MTLAYQEVDRLECERDDALLARDRMEGERDRARDTAAALEAELARVTALVTHLSDVHERLRHDQAVRRSPLLRGRFQFQRARAIRLLAETVLTDVQPSPRAAGSEGVDGGVATARRTHGGTDGGAA